MSRFLGILAVLIGGGILLVPGLLSQPPKGASKTESPRPLAKSVPFDGKRAMGYLEELCKIGPRISGSEGMAKQQLLLQKHFEKHGATVTYQKFQVQQNSQARPTPMANMIVTWHPDRLKRVLICGHYDTRPIADQEPDRRKWREPFVSANDGTSTSAWMMELAHHMKELSVEVGVDFVIFDGEEFIYDGRQGGDKYFFGSEHFAEQYERKKPKYTYTAGVLLDMIAGKDARFPWEQNSYMQAGKLLQEIWAVATELKIANFKLAMGHAVNDDHLALNRAGIPTVDIIDFDYPHWHRLSDTPANCSAETMENVAKVLTTWLTRIR